MDLFKDVPAEVVAQALPINTTKTILDVIGWDKSTHLLRGKGGEIMSPQTTLTLGAVTLFGSMGVGIWRITKYRKGMSQEARSQAVRENEDRQKAMWAEMQRQAEEAAKQAQEGANNAK